jgi:hypothetical protein
MQPHEHDAIGWFTAAQVEEQQNPQLSGSTRERGKLAFTSKGAVKRLS